MLSKNREEAEAGAERWGGGERGLSKDIFGVGGQLGAYKQTQMACHDSETRDIGILFSPSNVITFFFFFWYLSTGGLNQRVFLNTSAFVTPCQLDVCEVL